MGGTGPRRGDRWACRSGRWGGSRPDNHNADEDYDVDEDGSVNA